MRVITPVFSHTMGLTHTLNMARSATVAHQSAATSADDFISKLSLWLDEIGDPQVQATARSARNALSAAQDAADEVARTARHTRYATWATAAGIVAIIGLMIWTESR